LAGFSQSFPATFKHDLSSILQASISEQSTFSANLLHLAEPNGHLPAEFTAIHYFLPSFVTVKQLKISVQTPGNFEQSSSRFLHNFSFFFFFFFFALQ
jgi:hypothetical protein